MSSTIVKRCSWVNLDSELYIQYHDKEWGNAVYDDNTLFEMLILEGAQAGLSWLTVLNKREAYREAFDYFDPKKVSNYKEEKIQELLHNKGIIRNKLKIHSAINNAKVFLSIQEEFGSFSNYIWRFDAKDTSVASKISKDLKRRGMNFVGETIITSYIEAIGMISAHEEGCYLHKF